MRGPKRPDRSARAKRLEDDIRDEALDPSIIVPGAVVVVADSMALVMGRIVDIEEEENATVVHVDLLP